MVVWGYMAVRHYVQAGGMLVGSGSRYGEG